MAPKKLNNLISIVMPVYNCEKYIFNTVQSILNQTYKNWELIIVDDKSIDNTKHILENYLKHINQIKIFFNKKNIGPALSRNFALKKCRGKYIAFLDADDYWSKNKLKYQIKFMEKNNYFFSTTNYFVVKNQLIKKLIRPKKIYNQKDFINDTSIATSAMLINKKALPANLFLPNYGFDDYIFKYQILKKHKCYLLNKNLTFYRLRSNSFASSKIKNIRRVWNINARVFQLSFFRNIYSLINIGKRSIQKYGFVKGFILKKNRQTFLEEKNSFNNLFSLNKKNIKRKKISIIMPVYNSEKTIKKSIDSIVNQTFKNWELIIYNDGSTDKSKKIIKNFKNSKIKYFENRKNIGQLKTRNKALKKTTGNYIAFLDSDDTWDKDRLKNHLGFIVFYKLKFSFTTYSYFINDRIIKVTPPDVVTRNTLVKNNFIAQSSAIYEKKYFKNLKFSTNKVRMDFNMWLEILDKIKITFSLNQNLVNVYSMKDSESKKLLKNLNLNWRMLRLRNHGYIASLIYISYHIFNSIKKRYLSFH